MLALKAELKSRLRDAGKVALLGIGSELRGDDAAGILVANQLKKARQSRKSVRRLKIFIGSTAPENLTGEIKKFKPTHLIIVDSADIGRHAGCFELIDLEKISGISFSTHRLPTKIIADYLRQCINCQTLIIGIQPKSIDFGCAVSGEIRKSVEMLSDIIKEALLA